MFQVTMHMLLQSEERDETDKGRWRDSEEAGSSSAKSAVVQTVSGWMSLVALSSTSAGQTPDELARTML